MSATFVQLKGILRFAQDDKMSLAPYQRLFDHALWANRRVLKCLGSIASPPARALDLFAHVVTTERLYLERIGQRDPWPQDFWPKLLLEECAAVISHNEKSYGAFFERLTPEHLAGAAHYRNSKGVRFSTSRADLLTHVALHGAYHRGQIAALLREAGEESVDTDFITFTRG